MGNWIDVVFCLQGAGSRGVRPRRERRRPRRPQDRRRDQTRDQGAGEAGTRAPGRGGHPA